MNMDTERSTERLARYIITLGTIVLVAGLCWYFKKVLIYIICAFVFSLLGLPLMKLLRKIRIKGKSAPDWILAIVTMVTLFYLFGVIVTKAIPIISGIISDASLMSNVTMSNVSSLAALNNWLVDTFPFLGADFNIFSYVTGQLREVGELSDITSLLGSLASVLSGAAIALFSVVFISFFFIKDGSLFKNIVSALVPDAIESSVSKTIDEIANLLSRYFVGLTIEIIGVALLDFLGLHLIARLEFRHAIGIAFLAGILNIVPYLGPILGELIGVVLAVILKYGTGAGLDVNIWIFALIVLGIMLATQLVDNFIYQPVIYSTSIKANPLEIFIVILIAGTVGGMIGVLVAIPAYTVIRVIAFRFFRNYKVIQRMLPKEDKEEELLKSDNAWID